MRLLPCLLVSVSLLGCAADPPGGGPRIEPTNPRFAELKQRIDGLRLVARRNAYLGESLLADLEVRRPSVDFLQNGVLEIKGRVANVGGSDAGEFLLRYQVWFFGPDDRQSGELLHEEIWPGIPKGTAADSADFFIAADRMLFNVSDWDPPVALAVMMTADPVSRSSPRGQVAERNEVGNNNQIFSSDPNDPTSGTPWIVVAE